MAKKELGQVFTPVWIVELMLDEMGYTADNPEILKLRIMEPSFGEGAFLYPIIDRLIQASENAGFTAQQTSDVIATNVWGIEYDEELHRKVIADLNAYLETKNIPAPQWSLYCHDALTFQDEEQPTFDFVVGNPPYIRVHNMDAALRENVKRFSHSVGTTDLYVIFYELGLRMLSDEGVLGYIAPNAYMRNTSQSKFREHLVTENLIEKVINFESRPIFSDASTYTAITLLSKKDKDSFVYSGRKEDPGYETTINYTALENDPQQPWVFGDSNEQGFLTEIESRSRYFEELITCQYGVNTLRNSAYNFPPEGVEPELVRPVVKGSRYKGEEVKDYIMFPYDYTDGKPYLIPEATLASDYPVAYAHFLSHKEDLVTRDMDKNSQWYQYGRSQGLVNISKPKLVFNHIISEKQNIIKAYILPAETVVYSGLFVTVKEGGISLEEAKAIIETEEFCTYAKLSGKDMSGGFKAINAKILKAYKPLLNLETPTRNS